MLAGQDLLVMSHFAQEVAVKDIAKMQKYANVSQDGTVAVIYHIVTRDTVEILIKTASNVAHQFVQNVILDTI
jgi:deoxyhypusine synthase